MFAKVVNLGMTVMAWRYGILGAGGHYLVKFDLSECSAGLRHPILQKAASAATTVIIGSVWSHINKILFADYGFDHIAQVFGHRIAKALAHQLAWILNGKLDFAFLVPVGVDLQFAFSNPLRI